MIWFLLYPFRGTTDPPKLGPAHPIRRAFTQYGREASRHPVITLLISVAIAAIWVVPWPYLYTNNFLNGTSSLPTHSWTSMLPFEGTAVNPDIVMRRLWVLGGFMKALDTEVLQVALNVQNELLGISKSQVDTSESLQHSFSAAGEGLNDSSWWLHSPLSYWSNSEEQLLLDHDIVGTVNNGTIRHSVIFSGKRFEDNELVAADALVITLMHKPDVRIGRDWERRAEDMALSNAAKSWRFEPTDGRVLSSRLYELKFQPLTFMDNFLLALAYGAAVVYFLLSVTRLRALKSRIGLTVTVFSQIAVSIFSSFSICAILKIDLSRIPREAYPLVILTIGLENVFRLANAVTLPSGLPMSERMAEALGATGHLALATVGQNLLILFMLYRIVSPAVANFCLFSGIALIFDFFYLMTLFLSVLSVDVIRIELSDALEAKQRRVQFTKPITRSDTVLQAQMPVSSRLAGSAVLVSFVAVAQWHFFGQQQSLRDWYTSLYTPKSHAEGDMTALMGLNQPRSPSEWLRLQNQETIRDIIQRVKPQSQGCFVKVYQPLLVILDGKDRKETNQGVRMFLPAAYDFMRNRSLHLILSVFLIVAAVGLLMNYLLRDEELARKDRHEGHPEEPLLTVQSLQIGHALDVALLATSPAGVLTSIGLDRRIRIWNLKTQASYLLDANNAPTDLFPILGLAMDDNGDWLAIASASGTICIWDVAGRRWGPTATLELPSTTLTPVLFVFDLSETGSIPSLTFLVRSGHLMRISFGTDLPSQHTSVRICTSPLITSSHYWSQQGGPHSRSTLNAFTVSRRGCLHTASLIETQWQVKELNTTWESDKQDVLRVIPLVKLRCFLVVRADAVDLVHLDSSALVHTFDLPDMTPGSLSCFHGTVKTSNAASILESFTLVYSDPSDEACKLVTYTPSSEHDGISFNINVANELGCTFSNAVQQMYSVQCPGTWKVLPCGAITGVRKVSHNKEPQAIAQPNSKLRHRPGANTPRAPKSANSLWETWVLTSIGDFFCTPLDTDLDGQHLLTTRCGPIAQIGHRSVVVALGNSIKIIKVGHERYDAGVDMLEDLVAAVAGRRRKPLGSKKGTTGPGIGRELKFAEVVV